MTDTQQSEVKWVTAYGYEYTGKVHSVDLVKGTAKYEEPHPCARCGGLGRHQQWKFTGLICFDCGGHGFRDRTRTQKLYTPERYEKVNSARDKRQATLDAKKMAKALVVETARLAQLETSLATFEVTYPGFHASLAQHAPKNTFLDDLLHRLEHNGSLSLKQVEAAQASIQRTEADAGRTHVGKVGEKVILTLTVDRVIAPEPTPGYSRFAPSYMYLMHDLDGNKIVYRGSANCMPMVGESAIISAKVKEHSEYNGALQTVIERPKEIPAPGLDPSLPVFVHLTYAGVPHYIRIQEAINRYLVDALDLMEEIIPGLNRNELQFVGYVNEAPQYHDLTTPGVDPRTALTNYVTTLSESLGVIKDAVQN